MEWLHASAQALSISAASGSAATATRPCPGQRSSVRSIGPAGVTGAAGFPSSQAESPARPMMERQAILRIDQGIEAWLQKLNAAEVRIEVEMNARLRFRTQARADARR